MGDDLVKRLRSPATVFYEYAADGGGLLREAADRIKALEAVLEAADSMADSYDGKELGGWEVSLYRRRVAAIRALKEKE